MEYRDLGSTGLKPSVIGLGGVSVLEGTPEEADRLMEECIARGVTHFDVAPTYGDGEAECRFGRVLPRYRDRIVLAGKTNKRTAAEARADLETTLKRLGTDRLDLYQLHGLAAKDVETVFGPGGAMETFQAAQKAGQVRFIGVTTHDHALATQVLERYPFVSVLTPVNYALRRTAAPLVKALAARGVGTFAIKVTAERPWRAEDEARGDRRRYAHCWYHPVSDPRAIALVVAWALALPITAVLPAGSPAVVRAALDAVEKGLRAPNPKALDALGIQSIF